MIIKPTKEITKPAIANPLGCLNIPIAENIKPSNHNIQFNPGTQHKNIVTNEIQNQQYLIRLISFQEHGQILAEVADNFEEDNYCLT